MDAIAWSPSVLDPALARQERQRGTGMPWDLQQASNQAEATFWSLVASFPLNASFIRKVQALPRSHPSHCSIRFLESPLSAISIPGKRKRRRGGAGAGEHCCLSLVMWKPYILFKGGADKSVCTGNHAEAKAGKAPRGRQPQRGLSHQWHFWGC